MKKETKKKKSVVQIYSLIMHLVLMTFERYPFLDNQL